MHKYTIGVVGALLTSMSFASFAFGEEGDVKAGKGVFKSCSACHMAGEGAKNRVGPVLTGVVGRPAGSYEGYKYGSDLKAANEKGLIWSEDEIFQWLENPKNYVRSYLGDKKAKTKMSFKLKDEQRRRDVIAYLKSLSPKIGAKTEDAGEGMMMGGTAEAEDAGGGMMMGGAVVEPKQDDGPTAGMKRVKQQLVMPPNVPEHDQVAKDGPKVVEIELVVEEKKWVLDNDGTEIIALTYNGSIPAPMIVVHEGDYVELTLKNPDTNTMEHNIDLHAATGALGGAAITTVNPGEQTTLRFKATKAGAFLYHCAPEGTMTPYHVTHGMTGSIVVLPRDGLKDDKGQSLTYDKMYFVGENDFYVARDEDGNFKKYEDAGEDLADWIETAETLTPSHVVFNGRVGALTGKGAMTAKVGETVLFVHLQGNRDTRPHIIGGHGDFVWETGSFSSPPLKDQETWFIRGGSAGAAMYTFKQPGVYAYLNHNLITAVQLGAAAHVVVEGEWDDNLMKQMYLGPIK